MANVTISIIQTANGNAYASGDVAFGSNQALNPAALILSTKVVGWSTTSGHSPLPVRLTSITVDYHAGSVVLRNIVATPNAGYYLKHWTKKLGTSPPEIINLPVTSQAFQCLYDWVFSPVFERLTWAVAVTAGANGLVGIGDSTPSQYQEVSIPRGDEISLVAYPSAHYAFEKWYSSSPPPYTFYDNPQSYQPTLNRTWAASFVQFEWPVSVAADGNGTAYVGYGTLATDWFTPQDDPIPGETVYIRAVPSNSEFTAFDYWRKTSDVTPLEWTQEHTFSKTLSEDESFIAVFKEKLYSLTVARANIDAEDTAVWGVASVLYNGVTMQTTDEAASVTQDVYWAHGAVTLTATTKTHGIFKKWRNSDNEEFYTETIQVAIADYATKTYTAYFEEAALYTLSWLVGGTGAEAAGNAVTLKSSQGMGTGDDADKYYGGYIEMQAVAVAGWSLAQWARNDFNPILKGDAGFDVAWRFLLDRNTVVTGTFERHQFSIAWSVDAPSVGHGTIAAEYRPDSETIYLPYVEANDLFVYGSSVMLTATAGAGDVFVGWYLASGGLVTTELVTTINISTDTTYVAKFGSTASVAVHTVTPPLAQSTATVANAGGASSIESVTFTYGEQVAYAVNAEAGWFFKGWYEDGVLRPELAESFSITPTSAISLSALVENTSTVFYVKMMNEAAGYGLLAMVSDGVEMTAESDWKSSAESVFGAIDLLTEKCFKFESVDTVAIGCTVTASLAAFKEFKMIPRLYVESAWTDGDETAIPVATQNAVVLSRHCTLKATYWTPTPTAITLDYVTGGGSDMGVFGFNRVGLNQVVGVSVQAEFTQGYEVFIIAVAKSGYKFAGWYSDAAGTVQVSANSEHQITVTISATNYFAKFMQDDNAIYQFEGSADAKRLVWQSRRLMASRPFAPSAICVLADGYPVKAVVKMASSPDAIDTRTMTVELLSQDGRRLPMSRPERFAEVEIQSVHAVNSVTVGTSMEGVR